jgi:hypothetical protein
MWPCLKDEQIIAALRAGVAGGCDTGQCESEGLAAKKLSRDSADALREKLRDLADQRRRFGYCREHILLRREGVAIRRHVARNWMNVGSQLNITTAYRGIVAQDTAADETTTIATPSEIAWVE